MTERWKGGGMPAAELHNLSEGHWLVTTESGSTYTFDMKARSITRTSGSGDPIHRHLAHEGAELRFTLISPVHNGRPIDVWIDGEGVVTKSTTGAVVDTSRVDG